MKTNLFQMIAISTLIAISASVAVAQDRDGPTYLLANLYVENMEDYMNDCATPLGPVLLDAGSEILVVAPDVTRLEGDYLR